MAFYNSMNGDGEGLRGEARRYIFAVELKAGSRTEYKWTPDIAMKDYKTDPEPAEGEVFRHSLLLRRAIVGPSAKDNESNLVSVEMEDPDLKEAVSFPLVYLAKGKEAQSVLDLTFPEVPELGVTFSLTEGSGAIHIVGYHFVERLPNDYLSEAEDEDGEAEEDDEENDTDVVEKVKVQAIMRAKRRIQNNDNGNGASTPKKAKVQEENGNGAADVDMDKDPEPVKAEEK